MLFRSDDEDDEEDDDDDEDDDEVILITINGSKYYTNDKINGFLFKFLHNGKVGPQIGYLKNNEPFFQNISEA